MNRTTTLFAAGLLAGCAPSSNDAPPVATPSPAGTASLGVCAEDLVTVTTVDNRHGEVRAADVAAGGMVGLASEDQTLKFWDAGTGELAGAVESFVYQPAFAVDSDLTALAMSPDGSLALSGESSGRAAVWRVADSALMDDLGTPDEEVAVSAAAFAPNGELFATADASYGGAVAVHAIGGEPLQAGLGNLWEVDHLAFSPDGNALAVTGHIYSSPAVDVISSAFPTQSLGTWESIDLQIEHGRLGARVARWTPDGTRIAVVGDRFLAVLDPADLTAEETLVLFEDHDPVDLAMGPDGSWMATVGAEGDLRLYALDGTLLGAQAMGEPMSVGVAAEGTRLAVVHRAGMVELLGCAR